MSAVGGALWSGSAAVFSYSWRGFRLLCGWREPGQASVAEIEQGFEQASLVGNLQVEVLPTAQEAEVLQLEGSGSQHRAPHHEEHVALLRRVVEEIANDFPGAVLWDGNRLAYPQIPGPVSDQCRMSDLRSPCHSVSSLMHSPCHCVLSDLRSVLWDICGVSFRRHKSRQNNSGKLI